MALAKRICFIVTTIVALAMVIVGGALLGVFPGIMDKKIKENLSITNNSEALDRFIESPVANYMKFTMFSVKNKDDVNNLGRNAVLEEKGPYVFRQNKLKNIVGWNEEKGTIIYKETTTYFFEEEMSNGKLTDMINHANAIAVGLRFHNLASFLGKPEVAMKELRGTFIETHTVDQLLFGGIDLIETLSEAQGALLLMILGQSPKIGFYTSKNDTENPDSNREYQVYTGVNGMDNYLEITTYDRNPKLKYWFGDTCNSINGTDGKQFPPRVDKKKELYVFSSDICRSMKFVYEDDVIVEQIDAARFVVPENVFEDPNKSKENMCFCHNETNKACPSKKGVIPIMKCQDGKPVAISAPHFYFGEKEYRDKFEGLNPDKEKHQTFLDIETMTGTVIRGAKRLQMNLIIEPYEHLNMIKKFKELTYFPLFWVEEGGVIDEKNAKDFRDKVTNPYKTGKWSAVAILSVGCVILFLVLVVGFFKGC